MEFFQGAIAVGAAELARAVWPVERRITNPRLRLAYFRLWFLLPMLCAACVLSLILNPLIDTSIPAVVYVIAALVGGGIAETVAILLRALRVR